MDTIEIVGGVHAGTKRLQLKSVLERYGEIDICHKALVIPKDPNWDYMETMHNTNTYE